MWFTILISRQNQMMSSRIDEVNLYQINMNYDKHRMKINRMLVDKILSASSPNIKKTSREQSILMNNRHNHQTYNSQFKRKQNELQIDKKNSQIMGKLLSLSKVSKTTSNQNLRIRDNMNRSRFLSKQENVKSTEMENTRFVRKLINVRSTINTRDMNRSYSQHLRKSQMLSKFKTNNITGKSVAKNSRAIQKRIKLQPLHNKLKLVDSRLREKSRHRPDTISINLSKLVKANPQSRWE